MSSIVKIFGKILRESRKARGWSQAELAQRAGMQRGYISLLERGAKTPSLVTLHELALALETPLGDLLGLVDAEFKRREAIPVFIYALKDPQTECVHYVGQSQNPRSRYNQHLSEARRMLTESEKCDWIGVLLQQNLKPTLIVLEESNAAHAHSREAFWIVAMVKEGQPILNQSVTWREIKALGFDADAGIVQLSFL